MFLQAHPVVRPCSRVTGPSPGSLARIHLCPEAATDGTERERRVLGYQPSLSAAKALESYMAEEWLPEVPDIFLILRLDITLSMISDITYDF